MVIEFSKYHGAGNDFILIDDRTEQFNGANTNLIRNMCNRRFGVGADGLMLMRNHNQADFEMIYFNADGNEGSMCGNGGRCIAAFASKLGMLSNRKSVFMAVDGLHRVRIENDSTVSLEMNSVHEIEQMANQAVLLDTGSPHYVAFVENLKEVDVVKKAREIRYSQRFSLEGVNVNFVEVTSRGLNIKTYERGVEAETLACGTGVTASAIAAHWLNLIVTKSINVEAVGGALSVRFDEDNHIYSNVWKTGPVAFVYKGKTESP